MAYKGFLRTIWHRVRVANDRATVLGDISIREALEDATTSVAEFSLADKSGVKYSRGVNVQINTLRDVGATDGRIRKRNVFTGKVDQVKASSYPNAVTISATGNLGNLRLTTSKDIDLTGMTDQQAVRKVLQVCQVPFRSGDIKGAGYELGERQDVIWAAGTSGAQMVEELDRVFGYATIENGDGRVQRIKYSRVPSDYGGSPSRRREFHRGQEGVSFYGNERERGHIDEVINFWDIHGLEYDIGNTEVDGDGDGITQEGKEGCSRKIWAQCKDDNHKLLGRGVYVHGEFSSDLIQSSRLAKAICKRMMQWYNRETDSERVSCANDARINVGDLMEVKDDAFGIDLKRKQRYVIMNIQRDGQLMTLDGIGGDAGDDGHTKGGIKECCGTWEEDGTCTPNEQNDVVEPPPLPDLPDLPEDPIDDWCNPSDDPTCIPNDGITPPDPNDLPPDTGTTDPTPPNTTDPDICTPLTVVGACSNPTTPVVPTPGTLGDPEGVVPQGEITGGMEWAMINQWDGLILTAAAAHNIDPAWEKAMLIVESGGVSGVDGGFGAIGLMQVKPEFWQTEALSLGYDLYTDEGQIGMAAAILGGDTTETTGMDIETAFLTVYYPVYDEDDNLCLDCVGESGNTPRQYLNDIALFMAAINAAAPSSGGTTTDPTADICLPTDSTSVDDPVEGDLSDPDLGGATGTDCLIPGWNVINRPDLCEQDGQWIAGGALAARTTAEGLIDRLGLLAADLPLEGDPESAYYNHDGSFTLLNKLRSEAGPVGGDIAAYRLANYFRVGKDTVCVEGMVRFSVPGSSIEIAMDGIDADGVAIVGHDGNSGMRATIYATPGLLATGHPLCPEKTGEGAGWYVGNHGGAGDINDFCPYFACGAGNSVGGTPVPLATDTYWRFCFHVNEDTEQGDYKEVNVYGDIGEGLATYCPALRAYGYYPGNTTSPTARDCTAAFHHIGVTLRVAHPDPGDFTVYDGQVTVQVWDVGLTGITDPIPGVGECVPNPNYIPTPPGGAGNENEETDPDAMLTGEFEQALIDAGYFWTQGPNDPHSHAGAEAYDFYMPIGTPIYAPFAGSILITGGPEVIPSGHVVTLSDSSYTISFVHLDHIVVENGQAVAEGDLLAYSGATPVPTMGVPHLHLERVGGSIDDFLDDIGMTLPAYHHYDDVLGGSYVPSIPFTRPGYTPENPGDGTWTV